ncbi:hypothetical protein STEG23_003608 [Scotinomys teguina]
MELLLISVYVAVALLSPTFEQIAVIVPACGGEKGAQLSKQTKSVSVFLSRVRNTHGESLRHSRQCAVLLKLSHFIFTERALHQYPSDSEDQTSGAACPTVHS